MSEQHELAQEWLRYAEDDYGAARTLRQNGHWRQACYTAQQAAEKAVKAVLIESGVAFPRTHDLDALVALAPEEASLRRAGLDLSALSVYATEARYPTDVPESAEQDARDALAVARQVVEVARRDLAEGAE